MVLYPFILVELKDIESLLIFRILCLNLSFAATVAIFLKVNRFGVFRIVFDVPQETSIFVNPFCAPLKSSISY
ncbi:MAG: hypothetical protein DI622_09405 [Chryseobacterium sp.]|nr:MAG: hypothetical protein DI622_09405 [Chryseobacterium sp.]